MGYTPGFEGPHPSQLPAADWGIDDGPDPCGHNGCLDSWRGDETSGPGSVWSCVLKCGAPGSQVFYPDDEWRRGMGVVEARFICENKEVIDQTSVAVTLRASIRGRDNTEWAPYTPSGQVTMVVNGMAGAEFVKDARYRVTFEQTGDKPEVT